MGIGSALAIGALALLGIGGAILVNELLRRRESVQASAEKAIAQGLRGALGDIVGRVLPGQPAPVGGLAQGGQSQGAAGQVLGVLQGIGGIAQGIGGVVSSVSKFADLFGSGGGAGGSGTLAGGAAGVLSGATSPASFLDTDKAVIDFGGSGGGLSNVDGLVVD